MSSWHQMTRIMGCLGNKQNRWWPKLGLKANCERQHTLPHNVVHHMHWIFSIINIFYDSFHIVYEMYAGSTLSTSLRIGCIWCCLIASKYRKRLFGWYKLYVCFFQTVSEKHIEWLNLAKRSKVKTLCQNVFPSHIKHVLIGGQCVEMAPMSSPRDDLHDLLCFPIYNVLRLIVQFIVYN